MKNQNKTYSSDWSTFKDSLELSKEEIAEIDLKIELMGNQKDKFHFIVQND